MILKIRFGLELGLELGFGLMGKNLNDNGLQIIGLQLKELSDMKNKKIESGLAGLVFGLKEKQKKKMKIRKWAWLMQAQHKKEKKTKGKGE